MILIEQLGNEPKYMFVSGSQIQRKLRGGNSSCKSLIKAAQGDRNGKIVYAAMSDDPFFIGGSLDSNLKTASCASNQVLVLSLQDSGGSNTYKAFDHISGAVVEIPFIGFVLKNDLLTSYQYDTSKIALLARYQFDTEERSYIFRLDGSLNIDRIYEISYQRQTYRWKFDQNRVTYYTYTDGLDYIAYSSPQASKRWRFTWLNMQSGRHCFQEDSQSETPHALALAFEGQTRIYFGGSILQGEYQVSMIGLFDYQTATYDWIYAVPMSDHKQQIGGYPNPIVQISTSEEAISKNVYALAIEMTDDGQFVSAIKFFIYMVKNSKQSSDNSNTCGRKVIGFRFWSYPTITYDDSSTFDSFIPLQMIAKKQTSDSFEKLILVTDRDRYWINNFPSWKLQERSNYYNVLTGFDSITCYQNNLEYEMGYKSTLLSYQCPLSDNSFYGPWVETEQPISHNYFLLCSKLVDDDVYPVKSSTTVEESTLQSPDKKPFLIGFEQITLSPTFGELPSATNLASTSTFSFTQNSPSQAGHEVTYTNTDQATLSATFRVKFEGAIITSTYNGGQLTFTIPASVSQATTIEIEQFSYVSSHSKLFSLDIIYVQWESLSPYVIQRKVGIDITVPQQSLAYIGQFKCVPQLSSCNLKVSTQSTEQIDHADLGISVSQVSDNIQVGKFTIQFPNRAGSYVFYVRDAVTGSSTQQLEIIACCSNTLTLSAQDLTLTPEDLGDIEPNSQSFTAIIGSKISQSVVNTHAQECPLTSVKGFFVEDASSLGGYQDVTLDVAQSISIVQANPPEFDAIRINVKQGFTFHTKLYIGFQREQLSGTSQTLYLWLITKMCSIQTSTITSDIAVGVNTQLAWTQWSDIIANSQYAKCKLKDAQENPDDADVDVMRDFTNLRNQVQQKTFKSSLQVRVGLENGLVGNIPYQFNECKLTTSNNLYHRDINPTTEGPTLVIEKSTLIELVQSSCNSCPTNVLEISHQNQQGDDICSFTQSQNMQCDLSKQTVDKGILIYKFPQSHQCSPIQFEKPYHYYVCGVKTKDDQELTIKLNMDEPLKSIENNYFEALSSCARKFWLSDVPGDTFSTKAANQEWSPYISYSESDRKINFPSVPTVPKTYKVYLRGEERYGNTASKVINFEFWSCRFVEKKFPTPIPNSSQEAQVTSTTAETTFWFSNIDCSPHDFCCQLEIIPEQGFNTQALSLVSNDNDQSLIGVKVPTQTNAIYKFKLKEKNSDSQSDILQIHMKCQLVVIRNQVNCWENCLKVPKQDPTDQSYFYEFDLKKEIQLRTLNLDYIVETVCPINKIELKEKREDGSLIDLQDETVTISGDIVRVKTEFVGFKQIELEVTVGIDKQIIQLQLSSCKIQALSDPYKILLFTNMTKQLQISSIAQLKFQHLIFEKCYIQTCQIYDRIQSGIPPSLALDDKIKIIQSETELAISSPSPLDKTYSLRLIAADYRDVKDIDLVVQSCQDNFIQADSSSKVFYFKRDSGTFGKITFGQLIKDFSLCKWCNQGDLILDIMEQDVTIPSILKSVENSKDLSVNLDQNLTQLFLFKFKFPADHYCKQIQDKIIAASVNVCTLSVKNDEPLLFAYEVQNTSFPQTNKLDIGVFEMGSNCPVEIWLSKSDQDTFGNQKAEDLSNFVEMDVKTGFLRVKQAYTSEKLEFFIRMENSAKTQASKKVEITFKFSQVTIQLKNSPPAFRDKFETITIKVSKQEIDSGKLESFKYTSSKVEDLESDKVKVDVKIGLPCKCETIKVLEDSFEIEIDKNLLTEKDEGSHIAEIVLSDDKSPDSNKYQLNIVIDYEDTERGTDNITVEQNVEQYPDENEPQITSEEQEIIEQVSSGSSSVSSQAQVITSSQAPWLKLASQAEMDELLKSMKQKKPNKIEQKIKKKPVMLNITEFSTDGMIKIGFNQPLYVPPFEDVNNTYKRSLIAMSDLNVARDIIDFVFISYEDSDKVKLKYFLSIEEWTSQYLRVFMNFTEPLRVSQGQVFDKVMAVVKNKDYFVSQYTGEKVSEVKSKEAFTVPRQLPKGVSEKDLKAQVDSTSKPLQGLLILQLISQIFLKGSMNELFGLFYSLQFICYVYIYDVQLQANGEMFKQEIVKLIEFRILNPEALIQSFINEKFKMEQLFTNVQDKVAEARDTRTVFQELKFYIIWFSLLMILIIALLLTALFVNKLRLKIEKLLKNQVDKFFWNGATKTLNIMYLKQVVTAGYIIKVTLRGGETFAMVDVIISHAIVFFFIYVTATYYIYILWTEEKDFEKDEFKEKYGYIFDGIDTSRSPKNKYYLVLFQIRKLIFVLIPVIFFKAHLQIQLLLFLNSFYMMAYFGYQPHNSKYRTRLEFANDILLMIGFYHLILLSDFTTEEKAKYIFSYSYVGVIIISMTLNMMAIGLKIYENFSTKRKLRQKQKRYREIQRQNQEMLDLYIKPKGISMTQLLRIQRAKAKLQDRTRLSRNIILNQIPSGLDTVPEMAVEAPIDEIIGFEKKPEIKKKRKRPARKAK